VTAVPAPGARVELVATADPFTRLVPGDRGTVTRASSMAISVDWDTGSKLSLIPGEDRWRVVD